MAARNSSAFASDPVHQAAMAVPKSPVLAADPLHQAAVANPNSPVLAANPVHQASAAAVAGGAVEAVEEEAGCLRGFPVRGGDDSGAGVVWLREILRHVRRSILGQTTRLII